MRLVDESERRRKSEGKGGKEVEGGARFTSSSEESKALW